MNGEQIQIPRIKSHVTDQFSRILDFHCFPVDRSGFTRNGRQIWIRHAPQPASRSSKSENAPLSEYAENEEVGARCTTCFKT